MIQVYNPDNTNFYVNGDMALLPESAVTTAVLNGSWTAELTHPIDKMGRWKYLAEEAVIKLPSFNGEQLYRIKTKVKSDAGITCEMEPVFFDCIGDCFITNLQINGKNAQEALELMTAANAKYSGVSDIKTAASAYFEDKNLMQAINGEGNETFINHWGGEILYDNYKVIINERVGGDHGVELRYGKNIKANGLIETIDTQDVVTRIYPKAYNGHRLSSDYVDSELINTYPTVKTAVMTFMDVKMAADANESDKKNGVMICQTQAELDLALIRKCQQQFEAGLDKPKVTISADMVLLQNTELYKDYKVLETISLGDTVHCKNNKLGIVTDARVIELRYDAVRKKVANVTLGSFRQHFIDNVSAAINRIDKVIAPDGSVMADKIQGVLNGIYTQLRIQNSIAQKQEVRAILFEDLDPKSEMFGALSIGTQGWQIASERTPDGTGWAWQTAATGQGIRANTVIAGILADKLGLNYWNLDTGEFRLSAEAFRVDGQSFTEFVKTGENLLESPLELSSEYWVCSGGLEREQSDPDGGARAVKLVATNADSYLSADAETNKPIKTSGQSYMFSVWLKASAETTITLSLGHYEGVRQSVRVLTKWQRYSITAAIDTITELNQVTIGGFGSFAAGDEAELYIYYPSVTYIAPKMTQGEIFDTLTNDGEVQGIFLKDGLLYINATYVDTGDLAGWQINRSEKKITSPDGTIILDAKNNTITTKKNKNNYTTTIGPGTLATGDLTAGTIEVKTEATLGSNNASYVKIRNTFGEEESEVRLTGKLYASNSEFKLYNLPHYANGGHLVLASDGAEVAYGGTSSRRYKDHIREISRADIQPIYELPVVAFKYKAGYLAQDDPHTGQEMTGLYAEDVEKLFPHAVIYNNGRAEDWDEKGIIPILIKALQEQAQEIKLLKDTIGGNL